MDNLCGCWSQCPFCKAVCTNTMPNHNGDHSVCFHRPQVVNGIIWHKTDHLCIDVCSSLVASDSNLVIDVKADKSIPYKNYRTAGPEHNDWSITPDSSVQPYWKWFVCTFQSNLEERYKGNFDGRGKIPENWKTITLEEALASLKASI